MTSTETSNTQGSGPTNSDTIGYAEAVAELDDILAELDDDEIDIDVLSTLVERAAELITICRSRISAAQTQVESIVDGLDMAGTSSPT